MKIRNWIAVGNAVLLLSAPVATIASEQGIADACLGCHSASESRPGTPVLHGQNRDYLLAQLKDFKRAKRRSAVMIPMARGLSEEEMVRLADYFANAAGLPGN